MKTIKIYGNLRKFCGGQKLFRFDVSTPGEAIKALVANFPGLDKHIVESQKDGIAYALKIGEGFLEKRDEEDQSLDELHYPLADSEVFSIVPVVGGAWNPFKSIRRAFKSVTKFVRKNWKIVLGVTLIAAAIFIAPAGTALLGGMITTGGGALAGTAAWLGTAMTITASIGASLLLSGISDAISPQPEFPDYGSGGGYGGGGGSNAGADASRLESFALSGIVNTARQGMPCSIAYGRVFCGSAILSTGRDVDQT